MTANHVTISDAFVDGAGAGREIILQPLSVPLWVNGTQWNPANNGVTRVRIGPDGAFTFQMPWPAICDPGGVQFAVTLQDGTVGQGVVPSVLGPLSLHDLKETYGWTFAAAAGSTVPTPAAVVLVGGVPLPFEPKLNFIAGTGLAISGADNPGAGRDDVTFSLAGPDDDTAYATNAAFTQAVAAATWTINHSLNRRPLNIAVLDGGGIEIIGFDVSFPSVSQAVLTFASAVAGTAYLV